LARFENAKALRFAPTRYAHLSPQATESAIRLLDRPPINAAFGDILETGNPPGEKVNG